MDYLRNFIRRALLIVRVLDACCKLIAAQFLFGIGTVLAGPVAAEKPYFLVIGFLIVWWGLQSALSGLEALDRIFAESPDTSPETPAPHPVVGHRALTALILPRHARSA